MESDFKFKKDEYGTLTRLTYSSDGFGETVIAHRSPTSLIPPDPGHFWNFPQFLDHSKKSESIAQIRAILNSSQLTGINWNRGFAFYTMAYSIAQTYVRLAADPFFQKKLHLKWDCWAKSIFLLNFLNDVFWISFVLKVKPKCATRILNKQSHWQQTSVGGSRLPLYCTFPTHVFGANLASRYGKLVHKSKNILCVMCMLGLFLPRNRKKTPKIWQKYRCTSVVLL
jgi:hypothetical protein